LFVGVVHHPHEIQIREQSMSPRSLASLKSDAAEVLAEYTDPALNYAFLTYDRQGDVNDPIGPADILSANLLSLKLGWKEVIPLFAEGDGPAQRLRIALDEALKDLHDAKPLESYESVGELEKAVASLTAANAATAEVRNWTPVTVSKVLHRRRPQIVPINDSRVRKFYDIKMKESSKLRAMLWKDIRENEDWVRPLASTITTPDGRPLSLLRLADILIWSA
jgi:hypothetical protein